MFFTAPLIAKFYNNTELTSVVRVLSLSIIIYALHGIQVSFISKNLLFKKFFWSTIFSTVGSAIVGIFLAFSGFGVWALVFQQLTSAFINTLVLWITVPWRPKLLFSFKKLKGLLSFGWKMLVSSLIDKAYNEIRTLIIGKLYSAESLAFYNKGKQFPNQVVSNINASIDSILLPTMAQEQENKNTVKAMMRRAIKTSTYIMAPLMIGLAVCAEPVVRLLLTEKWLDSVFFMRIFCISFVFYPIHTSNLNALKAIGRSDWFLKLEIVKKIIGLSLVIATMFISVEAMAYSVLLSTLLSTMINAYPNKKLLNYSWAEQMKDIMPNILLAVVMGIPVYLLQFLPIPTVVILVVQVLSGAIIYIKQCMVVFKKVAKYRNILALKHMGKNPNRTFIKKAIVFIGRAVFKLIPDKFLLKKLEQLFTSTEKCGGKGIYGANLGGAWGSKELFFKQDIVEQIEADFEGRKYYIPIGYDRVLTGLYGNYMELPPIEKRITHHSYEAYLK